MADMVSFLSRPFGLDLDALTAQAPIGLST
jgi:hypothetical protein